MLEIQEQLNGTLLKHLPKKILRVKIYSCKLYVCKIEKGVLNVIFEKKHVNACAKKTTWKN